MGGGYICLTAQPPLQHWWGGEPLDYVAAGEGGVGYGVRGEM